MKLGNIKTLSMKLEEPAIDFKDITMNQISIFIGANGTGKSLILQFTWAMSMITQMKIMADLKSVQIREFSQFVMNTSFDNNFTGTVSVTYDSGATIKLDLKEGKCETPEFTNIESIDKDVPTPIYMSTNVRTFDEIEKYLKIRFMYTKELSIDESTLIKMSSIYKLYDVLACEKRYNRAISGTDIPNEMGEQLVKNYDFKKKPIKIIYDENFYLIYEDESREKLARMGKGHQSIVNMSTVNL